MAASLQHAMGPAKRAATPLLGALALAACGVPGLGTDAAAPQAGQPGFVRGFLGGVAADEPRAALAAREVLSAGGTAVDAAVAAGFMLTATLPSRAGLGGGGACLVYNPRRNEAEAVVFPPGAREALPPGADRPAALPMMARGLFALHVRGGRRPFEELLSPAEQAARLGVEVSRTLATDIAAVSGPLLADPAARAVFAPAGTPLATGAQMVQPDLGATLAQLRTAGVGDLHQGALARRLEEASIPAGGGIPAGEMRGAVPRVLPPVQMQAGADLVSFLPPPADGGLAAAAAFAAIQSGAGAEAAAMRGLSTAQAWRQGRGDAALLLASAPEGGMRPWPLVPASTSLLVLDREGMAVACAFTMNNLFGTGRVAPGTGILLAAAPRAGAVEPPLLSAAIAHSPNLRAFRAAAAGSGQLGAPMAVAVPMSLMLRGADASAATRAPEPGRSQAAACTRYLPGEAASCTVATDPRGSGLALGALDR